MKTSDTRKRCAEIAPLFLHNVRRLPPLLYSSLRDIAQQRLCEMPSAPTARPPLRISRLTLYAIKFDYKTMNQMEKPSKFKLFFEMFNYSVWVEKPASIQAFIGAYRKLDNKSKNISALALASFNFGLLNFLMDSRIVDTIALFFVPFLFIFLILLKKFTPENIQKENLYFKSMKITLLIVSIFAFILMLYHYIQNAPV